MRISGAILITSNERAGKDNYRQPTLCVYIPSFGRPELCLKQVRSLSVQIKELGLEHAVTIIVSINGDPSYGVQEISSLNAQVLTRASNLGGNTNICLGYEYLPMSDYLWILSDDDQVSENTIQFVLSVIEDFKWPDLIIGSRNEGIRVLDASCDVDEILAGDPMISLISATIYRGEVFAGLTETAFQSTFTNFPHVALMLSSFYETKTSQICIVPISKLINSNYSDQYTSQIERSLIGASHGHFFFSGGMVPLTLKSTEVIRRELRRWWITNWHRASMYRRSGSSEQFVVNSIARGSVSLLPYWAISLLPWWRLKDLFNRFS